MRSAAARAVAVDGQGGLLVGGQGLDGGQAGTVGADVQLQLDRDPAVQRPSATWPQSRVVHWDSARSGRSKLWV
jgi:hypothetical protein